MSGRRRAIGFAAIGAVAAAACLLRLLVGRDLDGVVTLSWPAPSIAEFRWTAIAVGTTAGIALSVSGVLLQALLRNPLASPLLLGVSAGAGLGVMIGIYLGFDPSQPEPQRGTISEGTLALAGALATLAVVYGLSQRRGWLDPVSLVLVGVIVSSICGALIMFLHHQSPTGLMAGEITRWMMGNVPEAVAPAMLAGAALLAVAGAAVATMLGRAMDAATLADDEARSVGLSVGPLRLWMFVLAGALTAAAVALCGPIGFVGLIAPHAGRLVLGPRHGPLVVAAALLGVTLVVGADVARQGLDLGRGRMPIGVFTALIGGPAFIWLLRSGKGQA